MDRGSSIRTTPEPPANGQYNEKQLSGSNQQSMSTLAQALPEGCSFGEIKEDDGGVERVIWVEFPPNSRDNPFFFSDVRKTAITIVACVYTTMSGAFGAKCGTDICSIFVLGIRHHRTNNVR